MKRLKDYLTIKQAAEYLGITAQTLRNWDKTKKLKPYRHPLNKYRLYKKSDLDKVLRRIK